MPAIKMKGWLEKKGSRLSNRWGRRYFELKGNMLLYYSNATDVDPKNYYVLEANCKISEVSVDEYKKKKQYRFRITWPSTVEDGHDDGEIDDLEDDGHASRSVIAESPRVVEKTATLQSASFDQAETPNSHDSAHFALKKQSSQRGLLRSKSKDTSKDKTISKPGWWSGFFGAGKENVSGNTAYAPLDLACESHADASNWIEAIEQTLKEMAHSSGEFSNARQLDRRNVPPPGVRIKEVDEWFKSSHWKICSILQGVRIFEQVGSSELLSSDRGASNPAVVIETSSCEAPSQIRASSYSHVPCYRVNIGVNSCPLDVFKTIMSLPAGCRSGAIKQMRVIQSIDNYTDIVHIILEPIYVYPTWTAPRDLCLMRYWKQNADKSYVVCFDSTVHPDCPLMVDHVRAELHSAYLISPPKGCDYDDEIEESLLTYIAQMDPRGWVWRSFGFQHSMLQKFMLHILDIRDSLDIDRFVKVHFFDPANERKVQITQSMSMESLAQIGASSLGSIPPSTLPPEMWGEPDLVTFRLRGKTYNQDKQKVLSAPPLFKLVAVDVFEVPEPTRNIAANPKNRVYLANQRGESTWCFVMNIMVPGPPYLCFVVYLEGDKKLIEEDTPFGRIARPFFYGNDDEFRNNRFKLIPRVVDGNMMIKMAVKDTPTLLGNKLKQYYYRGDNYFELDVDVGSSSVARLVLLLFSKCIFNFSHRTPLFLYT